MRESNISFAGHGGSSRGRQAGRVKPSHRPAFIRSQSASGIPQTISPVRQRWRPKIHAAPGAFLSRHPAQGGGFFVPPRQNIGTVIRLLAMTTKRCTKCGEKKPIEMFAKQSSCVGGHRHDCIECNKERLRAYRKGVRIRVKIIVEDGFKHCHSCNTPKPLGQFAKGRNGKPNSRCRCCHREYYLANKERILDARRAEWALKSGEILAKRRLDYAENRESILIKQRLRYASLSGEKLQKRKAKAKDYQRSEVGKMTAKNTRHKRRSKQKSGSATSAQLFKIRDAAKGRCHYCGCKTSRLTFDHIIPLAKGGTHSADNLVMACGPCNSSKSDRDPIEFAKTKGLLLV